MSTKSTIYSAPDGTWWLQEEMLNDTTQLVSNKLHVSMHTNQSYAHFTITLPDDLLDAIGRLHATGQLPYQRARNDQP